MTGSVPDYRILLEESRNGLKISAETIDPVVKCQTIHAFFTLIERTVSDTVASWSQSFVRSKRRHLDSKSRNRGDEIIYSQLLARQFHESSLNIAKTVFDINHKFISAWKYLNSVNSIKKKKKKMIRIYTARRIRHGNLEISKEKFPYELPLELQITICKNCLHDIFTAS